MRNYQVPKNSGGSYTPQENERPRKFVLKEKVGEMLKYGLPQIAAFPNQDKKLADFMRRSMLELFRLAVELDRTTPKSPILDAMGIELAVLKEFIVVASDRDYYGRKYSPPLSLRKREVWGRYNADIKKLIEGYQ